MYRAAGLEGREQLDNIVGNRQGGSCWEKTKFINCQERRESTKRIGGEGGKLATSWQAEEGWCYSSETDSKGGTGSCGGGKMDILAEKDSSLRRADEGGQEKTE